MQMTVSARSAASTEAPSAVAQEKQKLGISDLASIFLISASIRLWFNFGTSHPDIAFGCDAAEYLRNAQALIALGGLPHTFWSNAGSCLLGTATHQTVTQVQGALHGLGDFFISGPIFPLFIFCCYWISRTGCDVSNWAAPVVVQSLLTALSCVLIAMIGRRCWDKKIGLTAGLVAAAYPAFVLNSGRLYSESFACFLLCLAAWLSVRGFTAPGNGPLSIFLTGVTMLALQLTRSIMFLFSLALIPITFLQHRSRRPWLAVGLLLAGAAVVALPWLAAQKIAFGKGGLVVDRVGGYNFFTGNNVNTQGWLTYPYPDVTRAEGKSFFRLAKESFKTSPSRFVKLMLDKPVRLFKFPWNDFRTPVGALSEYGQVLAHQLILLFAALGLLIGFVVQPATPPDSSRLQGRAFLLGLIFLQLIYTAFITVPRYNLMAMPPVILFAAAGAVSLARLLSSGQRNRPALLLCGALVLFFAVQKLNILPLAMQLSGGQHVYTALGLAVAVKALTLILLTWSIWLVAGNLSGNLPAARAGTVVLMLLLSPSLCLPVRAHGRWSEWQCPLIRAGDSVTQQIYLPPEKVSELQSRQCYLLVDSDGAAALDSGVKIKLDGMPIEASLIPNLPFLQDLTALKSQGNHNLTLECEYIFECLTYAAGVSNLDLRQWFMVPVPPEILARHVAGQPLQVQVEKTGGAPATVFGAYSTSDRYLEIPHPALYSWEKAFYGVENDRGFTDTSLDARLPADGNVPRQTDLSPEPGLQTGAYFIRLLVAPPVAGAEDSHLIPLQKYDCTLSAGHAFRIGSLPPYARSDVWLVRISGLLPGKSTPLQAGIHCSAHSRTAAGADYRYDSPWAPRRLSSAGQDARFDLAFPLVPSALPGQLQDLEITLSPPATTGLADKSGHDAGTPPGLSGVSVELYKMPSLPMGAGHYIL